ncbi:hypothetical protein COUCH_21010 [Couchioplanes caeruleus]|uniref:hypothetical protein n=1 Tax=Couchioplanes caeruleus TaxID=56438 RepID=UPI0020BE3C08|nr:hypothetical protein [Couchioplanes caeruleus]UQU61533.1 hypothetical protein COUCH_21010 [Couchioplanes caeruleus]
MIDSAVLDQAERILAQVAPKEVVIVVLPKSMSVGLSGNPGMCVKTEQQKTWITGQMDNARDYVAENLADRWNELMKAVAINTLVIKEEVFAGTPAYQSAVIWHEYGHALHEASETGNVFLFEVATLTENRSTLGDKDVRDVLNSRTAAYKGAKDPGRAELIAFLEEQWQIKLA